MDSSLTAIWREAFEKHHSALIDDLNLRLGSHIDQTTGAAIAAEREHSDRRLETLRADLTARFQSERDQAAARALTERDEAVARAVEEERLRTVHELERAHHTIQTLSAQAEENLETLRTTLGAQFEHDRSAAVSQALSEERARTAREREQARETIQSLSAESARNLETLRATLTDHFRGDREMAVSAAVKQAMAEGAHRIDHVRQSTHAEATAAAQRGTAEALNQALRRLRQADSERAALAVLADASAPWAPKVVVLTLENNQARMIAGRNLASARPDEETFTFDLDSAGAVRSALDAKDPMVALASAAEISPRLAAAFAENSSGPVPRAYLFPVLCRQSVAAMLIAAGGPEANPILPGPLELLCEAAGMKLETIAAPIAAPVAAPVINQQAPELVRIEIPIAHEVPHAPELPAIPPTPAAAPVPPEPVLSPVPPAPKKWEDLSPDDQKLHLRAQRVAKVRVAEIRLYHSELLRKGVFAGDIYGSLRAVVDKARAEFRQLFVSPSATMVDYLHLEILRSLAHDDERLLGLDYPGPVV